MIFSTPSPDTAVVALLPPIIIGETKYNQPVFFEIPVDDMGDADFKSEMDAKLLNRWIVEIINL